MTETTTGGDAEARLRRFTSFVEEDPRNPDLLAEAWHVAMAAGVHAAAARWAADGEQCDPARRAAWLQRRAHAALAAGRSDEAAQLVERARAAGLPSGIAEHDLACIAMRQGEFPQAATLVLPWLEEGPDPAFVDAVQALWLRAMHRAGKVDVAWDWVRAHERRGRQLRAVAAGVASLLAIDADRFADARSLADRALAAGEGAEALTARGCVALAESDLARARSLLERARVLQPADGRIQSALGLLELHAGAFAQAQGRFDVAVGALPAHVGSWHGLGWSRLLQGDLAPAAGAFQRAVDLDPNFAESHGAVGLVLVLQGDLAAAQPHLRRARKLDPGNVTASFAQALGSGQLAPAQFPALARKLLDRPGFFGEKLSARWARQGGDPA